MFVSLISRNNLLECLNPGKEPFDSAPLFIQFRIEPKGSPALWILPRSSVDRNIAPYAPFSVKYSDILRIVGSIGGNYFKLRWYSRNPKCFDGLSIQPRIVDIGGSNQAGERSTLSIYENTQFIAFYLLIAVKSDGSPFLAGIDFVSVIP